MITKRTPWTVVKTMIGFEVVADYMVVAELTGMRDDIESDADLIAAAPDLLEILQIMENKDFEFSEYECRLARAAIAKATR